jgi:tetratricopeptide (TPR) repeat protein
MAGVKSRTPSQCVQKSLHDTVQSITFIPHAIVVTKKTAVMAAETLALAEEMATKSVSADHWHRLFRYIMETCGPLDRAEAAARNAIRAGGDQGQYLNDLGYVMQRQGRIDEAIGLSKHAVAARPDDPSFLLLLGQLHLKKRDAKAAEINFRNAIELNKTARPGHEHLGKKLEKHLSRALELQYEWQAAIEAAGRALELGRANPHWSVAMRQILKRLQTRMTRSSAKEPIVVADSEDCQN